MKKGVQYKHNNSTTTINSLKFFNPSFSPPLYLMTLGWTNLIIKECCSFSVIYGLAREYNMANSVRYCHCVNTVQPPHIFLCVSLVHSHTHVPIASHHTIMHDTHKHTHKTNKCYIENFVHVLLNIKF